jgi:hypothetical protein
LVVELGTILDVEVVVPAHPAFVNALGAVAFATNSPLKGN